MPLISTEPEFTELPDLNLVGTCSFADFFSDNLFDQFGETWSRFIKCQEHIQAQLPTGRCFGLELYPQDFPTDRRWYYLACLEVSSLQIQQPPDIVSRFIPANSYLKFTVAGSIAELAPSFRYIYDEWLPQSDVKLKGFYDLEYYDARFHGPDADDSEIDILLPIQ